MSTTPTPGGPGPKPPPGGAPDPGFGAALTPGSGPGTSMFPPSGGPIAPPSADGDQAGAGRATVTIATYDHYADAQRAIDYLSDNGFPVQHTAIIGTDLRLVENVIGRMTVGRAALASLVSGAWFGLFFGLILGIFTNVNWGAVIVATVLIGAAWGAIFGAIAHALTRGRRDFTSRSMLQARQYAVTADAQVADEARHRLTQMNWRMPQP